MKYAVLILLAFLQVVLAIVFGYKAHSKVSRRFIIFVVNIAIWTIANILLDYYQYQVRDQLAFIDVVNRFGFFAGMLSIISVYRLSLVFPTEQAKTKVQSVITAIGLAIPFIALFPIVSGTFTQTSPEEIPVYTYGQLVFVVAAYVLFMAIISVKNILRNIQHADKLLKQQAYTVFAGVIASITAGAFFITVLPTLTGSEQFLFLGYYAPFIFTGSVFYSLFRQQFLNYQWIVARSVAYIILVAIFAATYAIVVFGFVGNVLGTTQFNLAQEAFYILTALFLAVSLQPIKRYIDRATNRIFYRDAYDPQVFLNELNQAVVSDIELQPLLSRCVGIVERHMKVEFCLFGIKETDYSKRRLIGSDHKRFSEEDIQKVRAATPSIHQRMIVTDELEAGHVQLHRVLAKNDIAVIGRLTTDIEHTVEGTGYLVLGPKKSGNPFNRQDIQVLEIITKELVVAIQNALRFEEIKNFNITLQEEVKRATAQLERTNAKLIAFDETKDDFISMASHQLRTPLTSVKGYLSMVLEGDAGHISPKQEKLLNQAFISSERMVYLIADLLNVSRLKTGKFVIEVKPTNLAEVIEGEVKQLIETAESRGLKLTYDKPKDFPTLMLDETKIRQVIMNFVDNAIHYTQSGGHITVSLSETPQSVQFTVTDDGIGVPRHEQHHLFTKFFRAGNAKKARPDGTGLGLFMAKKVIIAQGGSLVFHSQEGKGSTFGFTFAKSKLLPPATTLKQMDKTNI